jgi:murein DD-endopeptidase MepM/ murein hydrolase activator NlpD
MTTKVGLPLINVEGTEQADAIESHVKIEKIFLYSTADQSTGITYGSMNLNDPNAYDVTQVAVELEITESIHSLAVVGSLTIVDNFNFFTNARIHGQEKIWIKFRRFNPQAQNYDASIEREFLVTNIRGISRGEFRGTFTLEFASPHVYFDKLKRIGRSYGFVELSEKDLSEPKDQYKNDVSGGKDAIKGWREKYTEDSGKIIEYAKISDVIQEPESDFGFINQRVNSFKYPEEFIYDILRNDLGLPKEKVWLYAGKSGTGANRNWIDRMKVIIPNWRPLQAIKWLIRNTYYRKKDNKGVKGHPWFCYDTLLAGIRIEPYEMLIGYYNPENDDSWHLEMQGMGNEINDAELASTGRVSKVMTGIYRYNPQYIADPHSVTYFADVHRKILEIEFGFSCDKYTNTSNGAYSTREWFVDIATKYTMPNLHVSIDGTRIQYNDETITQGMDTLSVNHYLSYADDVDSQAPDLDQSNYTYYVPYNSALHGTTEETYPYNRAFGFNYGVPSSGGIGPGSIHKPSDINPELSEEVINTGLPNGSPMADGSYRLTSKYGYRTHPIDKTRKMHKGIDMAAPTGTPVYSPYEGKVVFAGQASGYGNYVKIQHADGTETRYGHLNSIDVSVGQPVKPGQKIGGVGSTGKSTGPHLHYEIRKHDNPVDPLPYIQGKKMSTTTSEVGGQGGPGDTCPISGLVQSSSNYGQTQNSVGVSQAEWNTYRKTIAQIESSGKGYTAVGGANNHYEGAYQMGRAAKTDAAKRLGIPYPSRSEFLANPDLQEKMFDSYTAQNHAYLSSNSKYQALTPQQKMAVLGYAHNQGAGAASKWLNGAAPGTDAFGTSGTKYSKCVANNLNAEDLPVDDSINNNDDDGYTTGGEGYSSGGKYIQDYNPQELGRIGRMGDMIRKNMNFMQHKIKVLGDFKLNPGMVVQLEIQKTAPTEFLQNQMTGSRNDPNVIDEYLSGIYFVTECTHIFKEQKFFTYATINRDSSTQDLD